MKYATIFIIKTNLILSKIVSYFYVNKNYIIKDLYIYKKKN